MVAKNAGFVTSNVCDRHDLSDHLTCFATETYKDIGIQQHGVFVSWGDNRGS